MNLKKRFINIDPVDIIDDAQDFGIEVSSLADFRKKEVPYVIIDEMMQSYINSFARYSALGGLTTGIGGLTTSATFAGINTGFLSFRLYRLTQKLAFLNGFDWYDPLQKDKVMNIYFETLGINAIAQATLKHYLIRAGQIAATRKASKGFILKIVTKIGRVFGSKLSKKRASRYVPVLGGAVGAVTNYSFAKKTGNTMRNAFKDEYFSNWRK